MKRGMLAIALLGTALGVTWASINPTRGPIGLGEPGPSYDIATVVDVMGTVRGVWEVPMPVALDGLYLSAKAGVANLDIYLGPADFVKMFGVTFLPGDRIEVIGSRVMTDRGDLLLAAEVRVRGTTLMLRDKAGTPFWSTRNGRP